MQSASLDYKDMDVTEEDTKYDKLRCTPNTLKMSSPMSNMEGRQQPTPVQLLTVPSTAGSNKLCTRPPFWVWVLVGIGFIILVALIAILGFVVTAPCPQCTTETFSASTEPPPQCAPCPQQSAMETFSVNTTSSPPQCTPCPQCTTETFSVTTTPPPPQCIGPLYLTFRLDDYGEVFADGVLLLKGQRGSTSPVRTILIPCDTRVLAFELFNIVFQISMSASISNGIRTDGRSSWKCSAHYVSGWNKADFDDSSWTEARVIRSSVFHRDTCADCRHIGCGRGSGPRYIRTTL